MEQTELYVSIQKKLSDDSKDIFFLTDSNFIIKSMDKMLKKSDINVSMNQLSRYQLFLEEVCQQGENSIVSRNKNEKIGESFAEFVKKKYHLNIIKWEPDKGDYPRYMLLGTDKGILAYVEFFYHNNLKKIDDDIYYKYGIFHEVNELGRKVRLVYSDLDRPVFYIHFLDYPGIKGIYFETTEQIKDCLFKRSNPIISVKGKEYYCSNLLQMGSFEELIEVFKDLKKYNVQLN